MTRILLLGANGQVGFELLRTLAPLGEIVATTRAGTLPDGGACVIADLDRPDTMAALVARVAPDIVVNAAAYTAVDRAEDEPAAAFRANAEAVGALARACVARDATLLHYSTDYVFDGRGTRPYREADPTAPLGVYGASKLAGEDAIRASGVRHLILRTAWVYATRGHNFLRTMLRLAGERDQLRVVADQIGAPTPAWLIADVTAAMLAQPRGSMGVHHLVTAGQTSWHGFADAIMGEVHQRGLIARRPTVVPITSTAFPTRATRPAYSVLDTSLLRDHYGIALPQWRQALTTTLDRGAVA